MKKLLLILALIFIQCAKPEHKTVPAQKQRTYTITDVNKNKFTTDSYNTFSYGIEFYCKGKRIIISGNYTLTEL